MKEIEYTEPMLSVNTQFFIFDVESIGLYGEPFAVAGGVYVDGTAYEEFAYSCPRGNARGTSVDDRNWIENNIPDLAITHEDPEGVQEGFWNQWESAKIRYPGIHAAAECLYPVEANFLIRCVQGCPERTWKGPYPFHDIASIMASAGMDPMETYVRECKERPCHDPMADVRLSARLLATAIRKLKEDHHIK